MRRVGAIALCAGMVALGFGGSQARGAPSTTAGERFERYVRPLLAQRCMRCHRTGDNRKSRLAVDSREALLRGGKRGPAVIPGSPDESRVIQALRGQLDGRLRMPPDRALSASEIQHLVDWIAEGAPWPEAETRAAEASGNTLPADWVFAPLAPAARGDGESDASPTVIDRLIREQLDSAGLSPATPADKRTLLRRVSYDLIGLPPTREELAEFLEDHSAEAFSRVVDRLLASPHYGERGARHWLDAVRFCETNGLDFDTDKPGAFHYRDYVIEALNLDLPYSEFLSEQVAGDLLPQPRWSADGSYRASSAATAFAWFGEMLEQPNDPQAEAGNEVENQVDTLGKAFLGLTVACARCHEHKFDPIRQADYGAFAACFSRSTVVVERLDSDGRQARIRAQLRRMAELNARLNALRDAPRLSRLEREARRKAAEQAAPLLLAARPWVASANEPSQAQLVLAAESAGVADVTLRRWVSYLRSPAGREDPLLRPWVELARFSPARFASRARSLLRYLQATGAILAALPEGPPSAASKDQQATDQPTSSNDEDGCDDFESSSYDRWDVVGPAFEGGPVDTREHFLQGAEGRYAASSFAGTDRVIGRLVSPRFVIRHPFLTFLIAGGRQPGLLGVHVVLVNQAAPLLRDLRFETGRGHDRLERRTVDLTPFLGQEAQIEIIDEDTGKGGHIVVDDLRLVDERPAENPPVGQFPAREDATANPPVHAAVAAWLGQESDLYAESLARRYQDAWVQALSQPDGDSSDPALVPFRDWALAEGSPLAAWTDAEELLDPATRSQLAELRRERDELERELPESRLALVSSDTPRLNERLHFPDLRRDASQALPEHFLSALRPATVEVAASGTAPDPRISPPGGSGRMRLADWLIGPAAPLVARVAVNRLWQHSFGTGLVRTADNFGALGERPTHPELLDTLAASLIADGWSLKRLHRRIVLSQTYQQSSQPRPDALAFDPENRLWHTAAIRRIDAEALRDTLLVVSGRLDARQGGRSVPLHVSPFMSGDDLPLRSGPADGDGRRSIYLQVRHNHLVPLLETFDFPRPDRAVLQRNVAIVPQQALALLNDPWIHELAQNWASRLVEIAASDEERIAQMYEALLSRPPGDAEELVALSSLERLRRRVRSGTAAPDEVSIWSHLAHVLFNLTEVQFVR